jgi:DNA-binding CsgD family transcriptional regulator/tetratricopeptide (TPR) repeat protein
VSGRAAFVGREAELAALDAEWERARAGEFRCVVLVGDAGLGKSRLAEEALGRHRGSALSLFARARPLSATASFDLWCQALEGHLADLDPEEVRRVCGGFLDDLAGLLRTVASLRGLPLDREPPRSRLLESLAALVGDLARERPVAIVLDDIHLADASSWDVLQYLAGRLARSRLLIVATARPGELDAQPVAMRVLLDLEQIGVLRRTAVGPLSAAALHSLAEEILGQTVGKPLVDWLQERSRGNALFAVGLLHALREEGADISRPELRSLPEELAARVRVRVGVLDESAQELLNLLAVAGGRMELSQLLGITRRPLAELAPILRGLVRSRFVLETEGAGKLAYEISHPLIQETIYEEIGGAQRYALHREVGRALLVMGHLGEAAFHFARSADGTDNEAVEVLRSALRQAEERGAYTEALKILGAFVDLLPGGDQRWLSVAEALSPGEWVVDHRADADTRTAVAALWEIDMLLQGSPDLLRRAEVKARLTSFLSWGTGQLKEAEPTARDAIALYGQAGRATEARLAALELAYVRGLGGDIPALEQGAREVLAEARQARDEHAILQATGVLGTALFYQGRFGEGERALRDSIAMAVELGKRYRQTWGLQSLGWCLGYGGRYEEAVHCFEEAKLANQGWRESNVLELEADVRWLGGDLRGSIACAREAILLNAGSLSPRRGMALCYAAIGGVETGELAEARQAAEAARRVYRGRTWFMVSGMAQHATGLVDWADGDLPGALSHLRAAAQELRGMGAVVFAAPILVDVAEVAAELEATATAAEVTADLDAIAEGADRDLYRAMAALAAAWAALSAGNPAEAAARAEDGAGLLPKGAYHGLLGRCLLARGRAEQALGRSGALDVLREAATCFDGQGAAWRRDQTLDALRSAGRAGHRVAQVALGAGALTVREREIARLAAQRLTAYEIAAQLFISKRTVEGHLANIYAKLGVKSKLELAARLGEL